MSLIPKNPNPALSNIWNLGSQDAASQGRNHNSAAIRSGFIFKTPIGGDTLGGIYWCTMARSGTQTDIAQIDVYAVDNYCNPTGSSLATAIATPSGSLTYTSLSVYLPEGEYAVVFQNIHGTPASNTYTINHGSMVTSTIGEDLYYIDSTNSGATWSNPNPCWGVSLNWSGAGELSYPITSNTGSAGTNHPTLQGATVHAQKIVFPVDFQLYHLLMFAATTGSATHNWLVSIFDANGTIVYSSDQMYLATNMSSQRYVPFTFGNGDGVTLSGNTVYYIGVHNENFTGGNASNGLVLRRILVDQYSRKIYREGCTSTGPNPTFSPSGFIHMMRMFGIPIDKSNEGIHNTLGLTSVV